LASILCVNEGDCRPNEEDSSDFILSLFSCVCDIKPLKIVSF
jgi:hypothetical protein